MNIIKQDDIEILIANAQKPIAHTNYSYPLNSLDDRVFEILTYSVFKKRIQAKDAELEEKYDDIILMQGVGEKGFDCMLTKQQKIVGAIQCKKYSKNLSDSVILSELIKFAIHFSLDKDRSFQSRKFSYFVATSTGYTGNAIRLLESLKDKSFLSIYDFKMMATSILKKYKAFKKISFDDIKDKIPRIISSFDYKLIRTEDFNIWINNFPEIIDTFFEIKKVTDNSIIEKTGKEIIQKIDQLLSPNESESLAGFKNKYTAVAIERLNVVNFIGFDLHRYRQRPTDITLTELFVQPSFQQMTANKTNKLQSVIDKSLKIANIFKSEKNLILLGDPGAGKSLLVKFIMVHILSGTAGKIGLKQYHDHYPFRIELRKYNEVRESRSIIEYLSDLLTKEYQTNISVELLAKLIQNSPSIVFFDGLDEIFNVTHKNKMKESIETFSASFSNSKCIVTSRFIGYHDIHFKQKKFDEFAIQKFDDKQIESLVTNFYATQIVNLEKRQAAIGNCLTQIEKDVDVELKSNPLIMTLILILTSNNIVIPDSKLEIYEACTKTLVDSIDTKEKELNYEMPVKNKRLTFAHLAYWQYELLSKNQLVSYDKALKSISTLLLDKKEASEYTQAEEIARKFLEYAEKRSIYFEDNFTHKTFLEYYTADYLYINYFTKASDSAKKKVIGLIKTYLPKSFWYIVFELLLTRIDKEQADSELLDEIFTKQLESDHLNVFYFLVSNLPKFVNVSDPIIKRILKKTILLCIKGEKVTELRLGQFEENSLLTKIFLLQNSDNIFRILQEVVYELEDDELSEKDLIELYIFCCEIETLNHKIDANNKLKIKNKNSIKELCYKDLHLFCQLIPIRKKEEVLDAKILLEQIEHFGTKSLFKELRFRHRENVFKICTYDIYILSIIENLSFDTLQSDYTRFLSAGLRHEQILEHVKSTRLYFFHRSDGFEKLLRLYLKSNSKELDEIILGLVRQDSEMRNAYERFRAGNNSSKLRVIDKIFESKDR